ncbi:transposase [Thalassospira alkalitolerans]|uniref:transposase n=1 Tax=Thalassospira alkalitolerans TaxID=1293890 RepID=UPI003AA952D5
MPRTGRTIVPNFPHHIVQRGHNRQTVFASDADFQHYLDDLRTVSQALEVKVYAFCLMTNHVHLLLDPGAHPDQLAKLMKTLAGRMTRYRNKLEGRSGTLWEGRFKSSPVQLDSYLLECCRYIDLNPVRAGMTAHAKQYPWSSYPYRTAEGAHNWLAPLPGTKHWGTGPTRQKRYADFVAEGVSPERYDQIHTAIQRNQLTGTQQFVDEIARIIGKRLEQRGPGRPRKNIEAGSDRK